MGLPVTPVARQPFESVSTFNIQEQRKDQVSGTLHIIVPNNFPKY